MFANLYLARRTFDINFSAVKMAVGGWRLEVRATSEEERVGSLLFLRYNRTL